MTGYSLTPIGEIATEIARRASSASALPVYSVTKHRGFVPSLEYFKKQVFSRDTDGYKEVTPGEVAYATIHLDEGSIGVCPAHSLISPMYTVFQVDRRRADASYLVRYLKSPGALALYKLLGKGSVHRRASISFERLSRVSIPLPSLPEQRRVVTLLERADALLDKSHHVLALLDQLLQAFFLDRFGDPVTNPKRWPLRKVGEVFSDFVGGKNVKCPDDSTSPFRILKVSAVTSQHYEPIESKPAPPSFLPLPQYVVGAGDLLFSRANTTELVAATAYVWQTEDNIVLPDKLWRMVVAPNVDALPLFLWELFKNKSFRRGIAKKSSGSSGSMKNISKAKLRKVLMPLPPKVEQARFAEFSKTVASLRQRILLQCTAFERLRTSLQHEAFKMPLKAAA